MSEKKRNFEQRVKKDRLNLALEISCLKEDFEQESLLEEERKEVLSLDYMVKSSGNISGGQKSRLELARAIYHLKPGNILVLDSAFSCLDYCLRRRIIDNLNNMVLGTTMFKNCSVFLIDNLSDVIDELADITYYLNEQHELKSIDKDNLLASLKSHNFTLNNEDLAPQPV